MRSDPSLRLVVSAGHHHAWHRMPVRIALEKGWYHEEGVEPPRIVATGQDELTIEGVLEGRLHIALDPRTDKVLRANAMGHDLCIIAGLRNNHPFVFFGGKGITGISDLKGKRIGGFERDDISTRQYRKLLARARLDPDRDVTWVYRIGHWKFQMEALREGRVDVAFVAEHAAERFKAEGFSVLANVCDWYPEGYQDRVVAATARLLSEQRDVVKGFLRALIRAYRFIKDPVNFEEHNVIWEKLRNELIVAGHEEHEVGPRLDRPEEMMHPPVPLDGSITRPGLELVVQEEKEAGRLPSDFESERCLRLELVAEAARELDSRYGPGGYA